ncbi:MAG: hypothetical protein Q9222_006451 [Ikaeria aurantiellina]
MTSNRLPPIESIPQLSTTDRAAILDKLFEPSVPLHTLSVSLLRERAFESYHDLINSIGTQLTELANSNSTSDSEWLQSILAAHPRLGQGNVESAQSRAEQAQLNTEAESTNASLSQLNDEYEKTFPGLRYVVFVNGRSRSAIMDDIKERISRGDAVAERDAAIKAICDIAVDRAQKADTAK